MFCCSLCVCLAEFGGPILALLTVPLILLIGVSYFCLKEGDIVTTVLTKDKPDYFKNKVVWITGPTSGIGEALAYLLAEQGAYLILGGRREDALKEVGKKCREICASPGEDVVMELVMDVSKLNTFENLTARAIQWKGRVDFLINNAGVGQRTALCQYEVDETVLTTDLLAPIKLTKCLLPHFVARKSGHIVNISSLAGRFRMPGRAAYCSAKGALLDYFEALHQEFRFHKFSDINVTTVAPGYVNTNFRQQLLSAPGEFNVSPTVASWQFQQGLLAKRCAELTLRATSNNIRESWIAKQPELTMMYVANYLPFLWPYVQCCHQKSMMQGVSVPSYLTPSE